MSGEVTYKTHILIGVRPKGVMTVIADWAYVRKQIEVLEKIGDARNGYATFVLCTPTSIMPADPTDDGGKRSSWYKRGI